MASKGQKFNKYSPELKQDILDLYIKGELGPSALSDKYKVPIKTIKTWIYRMNKGKDVIFDKRTINSGRHKAKNLTLEDYKEQCEILKKYLAFIEARRGKK